MVTYVGNQTTLLSQGASTYTVPAPNFALADDFLVAVIRSISGIEVGATGWTKVGDGVSTGGGALEVWTKPVQAGDPGSYAWRQRGTSGVDFLTLVYRGSGRVVDAFASRTQPGFASTDMRTTATFPTVRTKTPGALIVAIAGSHIAGQSLSLSGFTARVNPASGERRNAVVFDQSGPATPGIIPAFTGAWPETSYSGTYVLAIEDNAAPLAATPVSPAAGATFDRTLTQRFMWQHNDPNRDAQSAYGLRYRLASATDWTTLTDTTANQYRDVPGGTFPLGDYEWQVRTTDSGGLTGPWSGSGFFTARFMPAAPEITAPVSGSVAGPTPVTLSWIAREQDGYQWRRVADASGSPAGGTVYEDSGVIASEGDRETQVLFPVNLRTEWIQLRVRKAGLWSTWSSTRQVVNYTPPAVPTVALAMDPATASLLVLITDPMPTGNQPPVAYHDVYVNDGDGEERRATGVAGSWLHWTPRSGRDYLPNVRVVAVGQTGATSTTVPPA